MTSSTALATHAPSRAPSLFRPPSPRWRCRKGPAGAYQRRSLAFAASAIVVGFFTTACTQSGRSGVDLPSVATEVVIKDAVVTIGELRLKLLLTPAELQSLTGAMEGSGSPSG